MLKRMTIDRVTLPQSLLGLAKSHIVVTFSDDDQLIVHKIAASIALFERLTGYGVFAATWDWTPTAADMVVPGGGRAGEACNRCASGLGGVAGDAWALVPVMRVSEFEAADDNGDDVTDAYELIGDGNYDTITAQYLSQVGERTTEGLVFTLSTGFKTADQMPPDLTEVLLEITADTYGTREAHLIPGIDRTPYANSWMTGWWVPRC